MDRRCAATVRAGAATSNLLFLQQQNALLLLGTVGVLALGIAWQGPAGIMFAAAALVLGNAAQTGWVWWRGRGDLALVEGRDGLDPEPATGAQPAAVETAD